MVRRALPPSRRRRPVSFPPSCTEFRGFLVPFFKARSLPQCSSFNVFDTVQVSFSAPSPFPGNTPNSLSSPPECPPDFNFDKPLSPFFFLGLEMNRPSFSLSACWVVIPTPTPGSAGFSPPRYRDGATPSFSATFRGRPLCAVLKGLVSLSLKVDGARSLCSSPRQRARSFFFFLFFWGFDR